MFWELFIDILEALLFFLLLYHKLTKRDFAHNYKIQLIVLGIQCILLWYLNLYQFSAIFTVFLFFVLHFIHALIFYKEPYYVKLFWIVLFTIATITADALSTIIPTTILHINLFSILQNGTLRIPFTIIYISVLGIFIFVLCNTVTTTFALKRSEKIIFVLLAVFTLGIEQVILIEQLYMTIYNVSYKRSFLSILFFLVVFLLVSILIYIYNLGKEREKNIKLTEEKILSQMENKHYEQIIQSVSELRSMKHDMFNHLDVLSSMLQNKNYEEAVSYIKEINNKLDNSHYVVSTGHTAIDCIVTNKINEAHSHNIETLYTLHIPESLPFSNTEVCSLLGNLFDNAIESCKKLISDKLIELHIKPFNNMLLILIENNSNGIYFTDKNGNLLTSKTEVCNGINTQHGIGLKRVQTIVTKYNGFIEISPKPDKFTVSIMIPL